MTNNLISVKDFSDQHGLRKQSVFKVIKRLEIEPSKSRGGNQNRGQVISYITNDEAKRILETIAVRRNEADEAFFTDASLYDIGVFYLLCLEPEHDPNRFKVGFANNINERLRQLKCSAPYITIVKTWPCRRLWEKTAIECVTAECERIYTEIFRANSLQLVETKCDQFFALMPKLTSKQA